MIPLIEKGEIISKSRSKRKSKVYEEIRQKVQRIIPWLFKEIDKNSYVPIIMKVRDIAKELGIENKSDNTIYSALRFVLFYEGIYVGINNNGRESFLNMRRTDSHDGFADSIIKRFDHTDLDNWYINRYNDFLSAKFSIKRDANKGINGEDIYTLESEGDIFFDKRSMTEEQAIDFAKYMSSNAMSMPLIVKNTPINIVLTREYLIHSRNEKFDFDKIGTEFRIVADGGAVNRENEFRVISIYGKECAVSEFDMDSLIKGCSIYPIMSSFDRSIQVEKVPERIKILKVILPALKTKFSVLIDGNKILIANSSGRFQLSLIDGTLHKILNKGDILETKYICVGPVNYNTENSIVYNGEKYKLDQMTAIILSKMMMLLEEKYPDNHTKNQILT